MIDAVLSRAKPDCCQVFCQGILAKTEEKGSFTEILKEDNTNRRLTTFWITIFMLFQKFFSKKNTETTKVPLKL